MKMNWFCAAVARACRRSAARTRTSLFPIALPACALALAAFQLAPPLRAQSPGADSSAPQTAQPQPNPAQEPEAQLHTGTAVGVDLDARLQNLLADHQFLGIQSQLANLSPAEAQFYRGILANRDNDSQASIKFLEPLTAQVTAGGNVAHENELLHALAQDYLRLGDWAKAATAYQTLATDLKGHLSQDELSDIEMPLKMLPLAKDDPPMTVDHCEPFSVQGSMDPLGLTDIPVFVDASPHSWMLDPTLPFNLIDASTARLVGLKVSDDSVTIHTLTGKPIQVRVAVVPRFTIGGVLTLRNMTVFVYNDADYYFPYTRYQVEGVLGYPALEAMGSLTVTNEDMVFIRPAREIDPAPKAGAPAAAPSGARFYLDGDQIVVALGKVDDASSKSEPASGAPEIERMYAVDAGGQQTYLTSRYYDEHMADFAGQKPQMYSLPGPTPAPPQPVYMAQTVPLTVGGVRVELHFVPVFTRPFNGAARDDVYGLLGADALGQLQSYTFNYRTMRFSVQPE